MGTGLESERLGRHCWAKGRVERLMGNGCPARMADLSRGEAVLKSEERATSTSLAVAL